MYLVGLEKGVFRKVALQADQEGYYSVPMEPDAW